jgi:hypothetical protein
MPDDRDDIAAKLNADFVTYSLTDAVAGALSARATAAKGM